MTDELESKAVMTAWNYLCKKCRCSSFTLDKMGRIVCIVKKKRPLLCRKDKLALLGHLSAQGPKLCESYLFLPLMDENGEEVHSWMDALYKRCLAEFRSNADSLECKKQIIYFLMSQAKEADIFMCEHKPTVGIAPIRIIDCGQTLEKLCVSLDLEDVDKRHEDAR